MNESPEERAPKRDRTEATQSEVAETDRLRGENPKTKEVRMYRELMSASTYMVYDALIPPDKKPE